MEAQEIEKKEKNSINYKKKNKSFKGYIKDFGTFFREHLKKIFKIFIVIAFIAIIIGLRVYLSMTESVTLKQEIGFFSDLWSNIKIILLTILGGFVPYVFAPVIGFIGYLIFDIYKLADCINTYGFFLGVLRDLLPLSINIMCISMSTSLGIYICKITTNKYKISNISNMNFLNFRIKFYEAIDKKDKIEKYTKIKNEKIKKLETNKDKIKYLQVLNTIVLIIVLQFLSALLYKFLI